MSIVLPKGAASENNRYFDSRFYGAHNRRLPARVQHGYDTKDLGVAAFPIKALSYRRNNIGANAFYASKQRVRVSLSHSARLPSSFVTTFAQNVGLDRTELFSGILSWPEQPYSGPMRPAPFGATIPFSRPFIVRTAGGKSLVVDTTILSRDSQPPHGGGQQALFLDADGRAPGQLRGRNQYPPRACTFANGQQSTGYSQSDWSGLTPVGGRWSFRYTRLPPGLPGLFTVSTIGVGQQWGPIRIPIDLTALGAPACLWPVGGEVGVFVPFVADKFGQGGPGVIPVPKGLAVGTRLYDGAAILDPKANAMGFVPLISSAWTVERYRNPEVATVYKLGDETAPTGTVLRNYGLILQLSR